MGSSGNLSALSTASYSLSSGSASRGLATANSQYLYATQAGSAKLLAYSIDSSTGKLTALSPASVSTGTTPYAVALRSDDRFAYVANSGASTVSVYSVGTSCDLSLITNVSSGGSTPTGIAVR